jgi:hypothetical protein
MNTDQLAVWSAISDQPASYYVTASEEERAEFQNWILGLLKEREITVDFEKVDGTFRSMKCTLNEDLGAKYTVTESKNPRKSNSGVCVVWDTAQQAWRSFRWDRVKRIQFDLDLG